MTIIGLLLMQKGIKIIYVGVVYYIFMLFYDQNAIPTYFYFLNFMKCL